MQIPTVVIVMFPANTDQSTADLRALLESAGPDYINIPGLLRKYFLGGDGVAGGVYEWVDRASAEAFYDTNWYAAMREHAGAEPEVRFYDSPAIADGVNHELTIFLPGATNASQAN